MFLWIFSPSLPSSVEASSLETTGGDEVLVLATDTDSGGIESAPPTA